MKDFFFSILLRVIACGFWLVVTLSLPIAYIGLGLFKAWDLLLGSLGQLLVLVLFAWFKDWVYPLAAGSADSFLFVLFLWILYVRAYTIGILWFYREGARDLRKLFGRTIRRYKQRKNTAERLFKNAW